VNPEFARGFLLATLLAALAVPAGAAGDMVMDQLVDTAMADLAERLSLERSAVEVLGFEQVTWPDASLGCPQPGMRYRQVPADGYRILLRAQGRDYAYHGDGRRGPFFCPSPVSPAGPAADPRAET
jgi:hypothetical protein